MLQPRDAERENAINSPAVLMANSAPTVWGQFLHAFHADWFGWTESSALLLYDVRDRGRIPGGFMEIRTWVPWGDREVALWLLSIPLESLGMKGAVFNSTQVFNECTWLESFLEAPGLMLPQKALVRRVLDTCRSSLTSYLPTPLLGIWSLKDSSLPEPSGLLLLHPGGSSH